MKQSNFEINFDKVRHDLGHGYFEETKQIRKRILYKYNTICSDNKKQLSRLNAVEIFNAIYTADVLLPVLAFQNKALISRNKHPIDFHEYECFVQVFLDCSFTVVACGPCCIICVAIADPDDKDANISQTTMICSTCLVPLCNKKIGNRMTTCFERFHQVSNLLQLVCEKNSPSGDGRCSGKKRKHASNNKK